MAVANTLTTLNGLFKMVYADKLQDIIPDGMKLLNMIPFSKTEGRLGEAYNQPVILGQEHGVTFAGPSEDAYSLSPAVAGATKNAEVRSSSLVMRSQIGYLAASRSVEGGERAFKQATKVVVENMLKSVAKKLEIECLYGQMGYATLAAQAATNVILIPNAQWAPGIWAGAEGMPIEIRDSVGGTLRSRNITAVDFDARSITVDGAAVTIALNDVIWHATAYGKEFAGIHKILTNTGVLFGIDASQYTLWKGSSYDAGNAPLSFAKLQEAVAKGVEKGLDNDVVVLVNPEVWADLLTDQAALRMYDSSYKAAEMENGSKSLKFHGQNGVIEIVPSIYCKRGFAYVLSVEDFMRVGSTDITFNRPGKGGEFFRDLDNNAGYEIRCLADECIFTHCPAKNVLIFNIA